MDDGDVLTITGSNDATLAFDDANIVASAYTGALTVTGTGTTGQFTTGSASSSISSTGATAIVATAMGTGETLTTSGAGAVTITGLAASLTSTSSAAHTITVVDDLAMTLALGTSVVGTDAITATALTDADVLTMTGANDATVSLVAGDLTASAYTGALTVTATTGTNIIVTGSGADTITGGDGADTITGGAGADTIDFSVGDDVDTYIMTGGAATMTTISNFVVADVDNLDIDLSDLNAIVTDMNLAGNAGADLAVDGTLTVSNVNTGAYNMDESATADILYFEGVIADSDALETLIEAGGGSVTTYNGASSAGDGFLALWDDGSHSYLSTVVNTTAIADDGTAVSGDLTVTNLITFSGLTDGDTLVTGNFDIIA